MESPRPYSNPAPEAAPRQSSSNGHPEEVPPADAVKHAVGQFAELREYINYWISAKIDSLKLTGKSIALYAVLGLVGAVVGTVTLATAVVLLVSGLAGAIGATFKPDRPWAGALIVGFVIVGGTFIGISVLMKSILAKSRKQTIDKYENRKRDDRATFGRDVEERAREQAR